MKEQLGTWLDEPIAHRLRVYAAIQRRKVTDVVGEALDRYLPPLDELVTAAAREPAPAGGPAMPDHPGGRP